MRERKIVIVQFFTMVLADAAISAGIVKRFTKHVAGVISTGTEVLGSQHKQEIFLCQHCNTI